MVNTVLGQISASRLGVTLMHEHITWDWGGSESANQYSKEEVVATMLPYLLRLKEAGCSTFVDATTLGAGRDIDVLVRCARLSGLNIVTNTGAWDGGDRNGQFVPQVLRNKGVDEIADVWCLEFFDGIEGTQVRPGFVKIALGDTGVITGLQERLLRAAARAAVRTKLSLQCHSFRTGPAVQAASIAEEEKLPPQRFIWVHADGEMNLDAIEGLARRGVWVEFDTLARAKDLEPHVRLLQWALERGLRDRLLLSQDAGVFNYGERNDENTIFPYSRILDTFIPLCGEHGLSRELFGTLMVENPARALVGQ